jgi:hypothetical protein
LLFSFGKGDMDLAPLEKCYIFVWELVGGIRSAKKLSWTRQCVCTHAMTVPVEKAIVVIRMQPEKFRQRHPNATPTSWGNGRRPHATRPAQTNPSHYGK